MPTKINPETMKETLDGAYAIFCKKNKDYGNSFERSIDHYGPVAALVRIGDKANRLDELLIGGHQAVSDESAIDTLVDMANYAYMLATYLGEREREKNAACTSTDSGTVSTGGGHRHHSRARYSNS